MRHQLINPCCNQKFCYRWIHTTSPNFLFPQWMNNNDLLLHFPYEWQHPSIYSCSNYQEVLDSASIAGFLQVEQSFNYFLSFSSKVPFYAEILDSNPSCWVYHQIQNMYWVCFFSFAQSQNQIVSEQRTKHLEAF